MTARPKSASTRSKPSAKPRGTSTGRRLTSDWREFLSLLLSHRVRFLLVGGHAVAVHARPRHTEDLDVFVEPTSANAERVHRVLVAFGFGSVAPPAADLARGDLVLMLGRRPYRIDVLTAISGVTFSRCWRRRAVIRLRAGQDVPVIGREDLVLNKRAAGRPKDLEDVRTLERFAGNRRPRRPRPTGKALRDDRRRRLP